MRVKMLLPDESVQLGVLQTLCSANLNLAKTGYDVDVAFQGHNIERHVV
jgi:hypothetical protein